MKRMIKLFLRPLIPLVIASACDSQQDISKHPVKEVNDPVITKTIDQICLDLEYRSEMSHEELIKCENINIVPSEIQEGHAIISETVTGVNGH